MNDGAVKNMLIMIKAYKELLKAVEIQQSMLKDVKKYLDNQDKRIIQILDLLQK